MYICRMTKQECHVTLNNERLFGTSTDVKRQEGSEISSPDVSRS